MGVDIASAFVTRQLLFGLFGHLSELLCFWAVTLMELGVEEEAVFHLASWTTHLALLWLLALSLHHVAEW